METFSRREFLSEVSPGVLISSASVRIPLRVIVDGNVAWRPESLRYFWWTLWPEAFRTFGACGIRLDAAAGTGAIARPPGREPVISGLDRAALNLVVTNRIPMDWDYGRGLSGVTLRYRGYHVCMVALGRAHGNQIPYFSVNTCVHEILHALLMDIYESRPPGFRGQAREFRVDACATAMWLFHAGSGVRESARRYAARLRADAKRIDAAMLVSWGPKR